MPSEHVDVKIPGRSAPFYQQTAATIEEATPNP